VPISPGFARTRGEVVVSEGVGIITTGRADPRQPIVAFLKAHGVKVIGVVPTVRHALRLEAEGADAVVMLLDIGCQAIAAGFPEVKLFLREHGIPAFTFEGSSSAPRYYDEGRVREQLEAFLENLGLTPLPREAQEPGRPPFRPGV